jgi:hypothetical protein
MCRGARLDRWEEQLAAHQTNVCDCDEPCPPCARCLHSFCRHCDDGLLAGQCLAADCDCGTWLSDTDCQDCDGRGLVPPLEVTSAGVTRAPRCLRCGGSGMRVPDDA